MLRPTAALLTASLCLAAHGLGAAEGPVEPPPAPQTEGQSKLNEGKLPETYVGLPLVWIPKRKGFEELTGDLSAPVWKEAATGFMRETVSKEKPKLATQWYLFCTDQELYIGIRCQDPKPEELKTGPGPMWERDAVEIFLEPYRDTVRRPYHHLILDAAGATLKQRYHLYQKHQNQAIYEGWSPRLDTLTGKQKDAWTCEVRIPFDQLKLSDEAKNKKTLWRINLYRTRPARDDEPASEAGLSPPGNSYYHEAAKFAYALPEVFSTPELIEEIRRKAPLPAPAAAAPGPDLSVQAEIQKRISELGSEAYFERVQAFDWLMSFGESPGALERLRKDLKEAAEARRDQEVVAQVQKVLGCLKNREEAKKDDDPMPEHLKAQVGLVGEE